MSRPNTHPLIQSVNPDVIRIQGEYSETRSMDKMAKKYEVNVIHIWRILKLGILPLATDVRKKLGLPELPYRIIPVPICPKCHDTHDVRRTCAVTSPSRALLTTRARNEALKARAAERGYASMSEIMTMFLSDPEIVRMKE